MSFVPPAPASAPKQLPFENPDLIAPIPTLTDSSLDGKSVDLLIAVGTVEAFHAVLRKMKPFAKGDSLIRGVRGTNTFIFGLFGVYAVALVLQAKTGLNGAHGSFKTIDSAVSLWQPKAVFVIGTAFGLNSKEQRVGDVIVSKTIFTYEVGGDGKLIKGDCGLAGVHLSPRFDFMETYDWNFANTAKNGEKCNVFRGEILSGPSNIQNDAELIKLFPNALGGELEGVASSALTSQTVQWIVLHGISQFNPSLGTQPENSSNFALGAAVSVCHHVLSRHCLGDLQCKKVSN